MCVTIDGVWISEYLLTTYTHHSELQVITALSLISTLYKSLREHAKPFPACSVFKGHSLATASSSGRSSASRSQILSSEPKSALNLLGQSQRQSQSQSRSYFTTGGLPPISSSWRQTSWDSRPVIYFQLYTCCRSPYAISPLMRGCISNFQLLLTSPAHAILLSESHGTNGHILLSQIRDFTNLEDQVPLFISPRNRMARLYPQVLGSLFVASYDSQGYAGGVRPRLNTGYLTWLGRPNCLQDNSTARTT
jgi:hypothetical protein